MTELVLSGRVHGKVQEVFGEIIKAFSGSVFVSLCSLISIPTSPVPITMQTLAVFIIGLTQSPRTAAASLLFYLIEGSLGLPVFCGKANPLWFIGPSAGYLIAFPIAAYLIARCSRIPVLALCIGQGVMMLLGFAFLSTFIGVKSAFTSGVLLFIPSALIKIVIALWTIKHLENLNERTRTFPY